MVKEYKSKGYIKITKDEGSIKMRRNNIENEKIVYDLIEGNQFIEYVEVGAINKYDGTIAGVYIDGYTLITDNIGKLSVTDIKEICENNEVLVNWANK